MAALYRRLPEKIPGGNMEQNTYEDAEMVAWAGAEGGSRRQPGLILYGCSIPVVLRKVMKKEEGYRGRTQSQRYRVYCKTACRIRGQEENIQS